MDDAVPSSGALTYAGSGWCLRGAPSAHAMQRLCLRVVVGIAPNPSPTMRPNKRTTASHLLRHRFAACTAPVDCTWFQRSRWRVTSAPLAALAIALPVGAAFATTACAGQRLAPWGTCCAHRRSRCSARCQTCRLDPAPHPPSAVDHGHSSPRERRASLGSVLTRPSGVEHNPRRVVPQPLLVAVPAHRHARSGRARRSPWRWRISARRRRASTRRHSLSTAGNPTAFRPRIVTSPGMAATVNDNCSSNNSNRAKGARTRPR